jgi:hypothetical protein
MFMKKSCANLGNLPIKISLTEYLVSGQSDREETVDEIVIYG